MIKLLELFGGIGACTQAFKRLGIDYKVVDYVEIDKYAVASYNAINGTNFAPQDITQWDKDIDVDFIMHGSPCQDFSVAGLGKGGDENSGTRSSLMYESIRIINKLKPKYVLWENVKNLVSDKHRHNFDKYLMTLESFGYNNYYKVLNAKDYGIPQNRERVFTLSIRKDVDTNPWGYKFPKPIKLTKTLKDMLEDKVDEKYYLSSNMLSYLSGENQKESKFPRGERWLSQLETTNVKGVAATISTNAGNRPVDNFIIDDVEDEPTDKSWLSEKIKSFYDKNGYIPDVFNAWNEVDVGDVAPTLTTGAGNPGNRTGLCVKEEQYYNKAIAETLKDADIDNVKDVAYIDGYNRALKTDGITPTITTRVSASNNDFIIQKLDLPQKVIVRKYDVDKEKLVDLLREKKAQSGLSNKDISDKLNVPLTSVEHWFRKDDSFSIPSSGVWFELKQLLNMENEKDFDESIATFEEKDGVYDKANRVYSENGLSPTITASSGGEKVLVSDNLKERLCNSLIENNLVEEGDVIRHSYTNNRLDNGIENMGRIESKDKLSPTLDTRCDCLGVVVKVGNYSPSGHNAASIVDSDGIAPTVMENHGTVTATVVEDGVYTDLEKSLFTEDGNIKRYIDSDIVDEFKEGQLATTSFPNGYGHGTRVHNESTTLNVTEVPSVKNNLRIRKLTPKECWRLMGFSDDAFEKASKVNSNAQLYKQAGNSIVVNVLESILKNLFVEEPKNIYYTTQLF